MDAAVKVNACVPLSRQGLSRRRFVLERPVRISSAKCAECQQIDLCEYDDTDGQTYCRRCWVQYMAEGGDVAVDIVPKRICSNNHMWGADDAQASGAGCGASKTPNQIPVFAAHLRTLLDDPVQPPQSAASSSFSGTKPSAAPREVSKDEPVRLEEAIVSEVSKLNCQIDLLQGKLKTADEEFARTASERDLQVADLKAQLACKTRVLEDEIGELSAKIVQAMADKKQTEETLQSIRDDSRCQIENLPAANKAKTLEISRNSIREELDKLLLKRAEVNSWCVRHSQQEKQIEHLYR